MSKNPEKAKFCSACGSEIHHQESFGKTPSITKDAGLKKFLLYVVLIVLIVLIGRQIAESAGLIASPDSPSSTQSPTNSIAQPPSEKPEAPWFPSGFTELTSTVAYMPFESGTMECGYSSAHGCYQIYVLTKVDCSIFVDVNFLSDGVVIDDGIDSATVQAGETAILTFASFDSPRYSGSKTVKITDVNCF